MGFDKNIRKPLRYLSTLSSDTSAIRRRPGFWRWPETTGEVLLVILPVLVGLVLGALLLFAGSLPSDWAGLIVLVSMTPTIVLLVQRMRRLLLVGVTVGVLVLVGVVVGVWVGV